MVFIDWQVILIRLAIRQCQISQIYLSMIFSSSFQWAGYVHCIWACVFVIWGDEPLIWFSYDPESNSYIEILIWEYVAWVLLISAVGLQTDQSVLSACHGLWNGLHGIIISLCPPCHSGIVCTGHLRLNMLPLT